MWGTSERPARAHHEDIARLWRVPGYPKQFKQVPQLTMDVAADSDWARDRLDVGFLDQDRPHGTTQVLHGALRQVVTLPELGHVQIWVEIPHLDGRGPFGRSLSLGVALCSLLGNAHLF